MGAFESTAQPTGRIVYLSEIPADEPPRMFADEPDVLNVRRIAELLGVDEKTVRREIARGRLACFHVGSRVRVTKQQLVNYVAGCRE